MLVPTPQPVVRRAKPAQSSPSVIRMRFAGLGSASGLRWDDFGYEEFMMMQVVES
jgi:hypothetical protein